MIGRELAGPYRVRLEDVHGRPPLLLARRAVNLSLSPDMRRRAR
jgi:hypothetical protein